MPRPHLSLNPLRSALLCAVCICTYAPGEYAAAQLSRPTATDLSAVLTPDTVFAPAGHPRIVYIHTAESETVSLRLTVPVNESWPEAGAGRLLQLIATEHASGRATPIGARVTGTRTSTSIVYTVSGPIDELDYLAYVLREATRPPSDDIAFQRARARMLADVRRREETASGRIAADLLTQLDPEHPPIFGSTGSLELLTLASVRALWERSHDPRNMTLLVTGDLPHEMILLTSLDLGTEVEPSRSASTASAPRVPANRTQVIRHWFGEAHVVPGVDDPHGEVATLLVADYFRRSAEDFETTVELWELGNRRALAMIGAAYAGAQRAMRSKVESGITATADALTSTQVEAAVAMVRKRALFEARTPEGLSSFVGRHVDATADPEGAVNYMTRLDGISITSMTAFLTELAASTPIRADLRP